MSEELRSKIAEIDRKVLELVAERMHIAEKVGVQKRKKGVEVVDPEVEAAVVSKAEALGDSLGLDRSFTDRLIALLIEEAVRVQEPSVRRRSHSDFSLFAETVGREGRTEKVIRFDRDEAGLPLLEPAGKVLRDAVANSFLTGHPSAGGPEALRETVCDWLNERYGLDLEAKQVLVTLGGKFAAFAAILALVSQGGRAIILSPSSPVYGSTVRLVGGREYTLHTSLEEQWDLDMGKLGQLLRVHPELMVVSIPNNPTGKVYSEKVLREMVTMAEEAKTCVLADETYSAYARGSSASLLQVAESSFVSVNTFPTGLAGCGVGYAVSDEETVEKMEKIMQSVINPGFAQETVVKALTGGQSFYREYETEMHMRVALASQALDHLPVKFYRADEGMYLFPKVELKAFDSEVFARRLLKEERVAVSPGQAFGEYPEHFRISLGASKEEISKGIMRIGRALERWARE